MSGLPRDVTLKQRVKHRLRSRYVGWLARNKPDTICYRDAWRSSCRSFRRTRYAFWRCFDPAIPNWLILVLGTVSGIFLIVGFVYGCGVLAVGILRSAPPELAPLSPEDLSRLGFYRLAIIQLAALVAFIPMGISFRSSSEEFRSFQRVMFRVRRQGQVMEIRFFAAAMILVSWVAAWIVPLDLPWYVLSAFVTSVTAMILFWAIHWISRWLGRWRITFKDRGAEAVGVFLAFIACLATFPLVLLTPGVEFAKWLAWLGPTGWLNEQALQIGEGNLGHAVPIVGAWGVIGVIGYLARWQATTWKHRRRILRRNYASAGEVKASNKRDAYQLDRIPTDFRNRLRAVPTTFREWLFPTWLRPSRTLILVMAVSCLATQGVAYAVHRFMAQLGENNPNPFRGELIYIYVVIVMMVGAIELCGLYNQDDVLLAPFERQPLSAWGLLRRLHIHGLIRIPTAILWSLPFLVVPTIIERANPSIPLSVVGLSLLAVFALRNVAAGLVVQQAIYDEMYVWLAAILRLLSLGVALGIGVLILLSSMPGLWETSTTVVRQLAAQGSAMLYLLLAVQAWSWTPRLATGKQGG